MSNSFPPPPRIDREVRKANRELNHQMNKMDDMDKIDLLTKRSSELFANMKRLERENLKNKKRADQLQKEKDTSRTDLSKQIGLKEKLEKLCRELQKENNKLKVYIHLYILLYIHLILFSTTPFASFTLPPLYPPFTPLHSVVYGSTGFLSVLASWDLN